jgi:hypothetical protein
VNRTELHVEQAKGCCCTADRGHRLLTCTAAANFPRGGMPLRWAICSVEHDQQLESAAAPGNMTSRWTSSSSNSSSSCCSTHLRRARACHRVCSPATTRSLRSCMSTTATMQVRGQEGMPSAEASLVLQRVPSNSRPATSCYARNVPVHKQHQYGCPRTCVHTLASSAPSRCLQGNHGELVSANVPLNLGLKGQLHLHQHLQQYRLREVAERHDAVLVFIHVSSGAYLPG